MTEMLKVPSELPPVMHPFVASMLYGLWGWLTRPLQVVVKVGVPDMLGDEPQSAESLAAPRVATPTRWIAFCVYWHVAISLSACRMGLISIRRFRVACGAMRRCRPRLPRYYKGRRSIRQRYRTLSTRCAPDGPRLSRWHRTVFLPICALIPRRHAFSIGR
jgi:hypothetical protein